jgi:hypothetical protein
MDPEPVIEDILQLEKVCIHMYISLNLYVNTLRTMS